MSHKDPMIEFLTQPDNMRFLLEIEPLIKETINYKYKKQYEMFLQEYLYPDIWTSYLSNLDNNTLILIRETFQEKEKGYFKIHVHVGQRDINNWYGIYGEEEKLNQPIHEFQVLKELLKKQGVTKKDGETLAYEYFLTDRKNLLVLPEKEIAGFLKEWSDIFWNFAENIKSAVEAANEIIRSQNI